MVLAAALSAFVAAAVPALLFMAVWVAVTVFRILFPERSLPFVRKGVVERRAARAQGEAIGVGLREIHEDLRAQTRKVSRSFDHVVGGSQGIPEEWLEDLHRRRN